MKRLLLARLVMIAVLAAAPGCDFFRPEQPEPSTDAPFLPDYSSPDAALQTIADAIRDKARTIGITAYAGAFAESTTTSTPGYHHLFWPNDVFNWSSANGGRQPPPDWNFALEQNFYIKLVNLRGDAYRLRWTVDDPNPDDVRDDQAFIHRHYSVTTVDENETVTSTLAVGFADLTFVRFPDGNWRITRWDDRIDPDADPNDPDAATLGRQRLNTQ